ncbi:MAG: HRDC domain-containing protein [Xanthomonadales bacterium]|nr:HRDC domain-containing protein [Xanthomonadales bacterium]
MAAWIDRTEKLHDLDQHPGHLIGLDTEFMRTDSFAPKLALIQIEIAEHIALIDPLAGIDMHDLAARLGDPQTISIMHSASEDLDALSPLLPNSLGTLFDTQIAAAFCGLGAGLGYQKLVLAVCGVDLPKGETRSDWLQRPLSPSQLEYAAQDVVHLPVLHADLSARLAQRGYAGWHAEDCARLVERARHREPDLQPHIGYRGAADWSREQQALLRRVLIWRDATARRIDKPRPWILDDPRVLDFSASPPTNINDLAERGRGLRALRGAERTELFEVLRRPLSEDELDFETIPAAADGEERRMIRSLKEIVCTRASELDLPEGLLCSRRHLESLYVSRQWPAALEGWRKPLLHDALMARLADA